MSDIAGSDKTPRDCPLPLWSGRWRPTSQHLAICVGLDTCTRGGLLHAPTRASVLAQCCDGLWVALVACRKESGASTRASLATGASPLPSASVPVCVLARAKVLCLDSGERRVPRGRPTVHRGTNQGGLRHHDQGQQRPGGLDARGCFRQCRSGAGGAGVGQPAAGGEGQRWRHRLPCRVQHRRPGVHRRADQGGGVTLQPRTTRAALAPRDTPCAQ